MNSSLLRRIAIALLMLPMSISSCTTVNQRLTASAATEGRVKAGLNLPEYPADCRLREAHAALSAGDELRAVLVRERAALDRQNARGRRCAEFYDTLRNKMEIKP